LARQLRAEGSETVEVFDGVTMEALGPGLEAEEHIGTGGLPNENVEAEGEPVGPMLPEGDLYARGEVGLMEDERDGACHCLVEAVGEEAGFDPGHAEHGLLRESDALDGEVLLGVGGLVGVDGVGAEVGDFFGVSMRTTAKFSGLRECLRVAGIDSAVACRRRGTGSGYC
jgi:hypothetical protein